MSRKSTDTPEVQQESDSQEFVYLIAFPVVGKMLHKIGRSKKSRQATPATRASIPSAVKRGHQIATNNSEWLEKSLHVLFASKRVNGEWLDLSQAELTILCQVNRVDGPPYVRSRIPTNEKLKQLCQRTGPSDDDRIGRFEDRYVGRRRPGRQPQWPPPIYVGKTGRSFTRVYINTKPRDFLLGMVGISRGRIEIPGGCGEIGGGRLSPFGDRRTPECRYHGYHG